MKQDDVWNPERVILQHASKRIVKVHEGYLPTVLALMSRGLVRIVSHANGIIRVGPGNGHRYLISEVEDK